MRVAVLMGGSSAEREVSLKSGRAVCEALNARGYEVIPIDVGRDVAQQLTAAKVDVAFIALHGKYGEDGTIQGLLEILGIPYTGSGVLASAVAMDKITTKRLLLAESLPTPRFCVISRPLPGEEPWETYRHEVLTTVGLPAVVKPATQGSTIGVTFVHTEDVLLPGLQEAFRYDDRVLVEEFISGPEVTAAVLGNRHPRVLPLIEIVSETGVYDYYAKYTPGMSAHIIPPRLPAGLCEEISELALKVYRLLGCKGFARIDFLVGNGRPYVLEVNTIPGLTEVSLFPDAARAAGISLGELVEELLRLALENTQT